MLLFDPESRGRAVALHAGDSRIYRVRDGKLSRLTRDHSLAEEIGLADESDLPLQFQGVVTRAVGIDAATELDVTPVDVKLGDVFIVCTDGLTRMVTDGDIEELVGAANKANLKVLVKRLVNEANGRGGLDNTTVIAVRVGAHV